MRVAFNRERCVWCRSCELICSLQHEGECVPSLSRIKVVPDLFRAEVEGFVCRQCPEPACIRACPVGAITMDDATNIPVIMQDQCVACGLCSQACPYNEEGNVIFLHPTTNVYVKCELCAGSPQCIDICPSEALQLVEV
jgi:Fe-S-cluster-containing hydrogenase component 2